MKSWRCLWIWHVVGSILSHCSMSPCLRTCPQSLRSVESSQATSITKYSISLPEAGICTPEGWTYNDPPCTTLSTLLACARFAKGAVETYVPSSTPTRVRFITSNFRAYIKNVLPFLPPCTSRHPGQFSCLKQRTLLLNGRWFALEYRWIVKAQMRCWH